MRAPLKVLKLATTLFPVLADPQRTPFTQSALVRLRIDEIERELKKKYPNRKHFTFEVACDLGYTASYIRYIKSMYK